MRAGSIIVRKGGGARRLLVSSGCRPGGEFVAIPAHDMADMACGGDMIVRSPDGDDRAVVLCGSLAASYLDDGEWTVLSVLGRACASLARSTVRRAMTGEGDFPSGRLFERGKPLESEDDPRWAFYDRLADEVSALQGPLMERIWEEERG